MRKKKDLLDEYQKLKTELIFEQVKNAVKDNPKNFRSHLEALGFEWTDDDNDNEEVIEENNAFPKNENQKQLVSYFDGDSSLTEHILDVYEKEKNSYQPNFPLFRKYFRKGNDRLKELIMFALSKHPTNQDYLWDLTLFNEYKNILSYIILAYTEACDKEEDINEFRRLSEDFWYYTKEDGYDALYALRELCNDNPEKMAIIESVDKDKDSEFDIEF